MPRQTEEEKKAKARERIEGPPLSHETQSIVHAWIAVATVSGARAQCMDLYESYWRYCKEKSFVALSYRNFMRALGAKYQWEPQFPGVAYVGLELK